MSADSLIQTVLGIAIYIAWASPAILFIVFLILFIVNLKKYKKERAKKFKVKSIVFGCLSGYFLITAICLICLVIFLASAVAHM